ncbi:MAG: ABC transporter substrate-binding protein [Bradyrhizobium sp.]|nr:ABC transporter substrate-binding protein [Bradyrhizobium sp.]
MQRRNFIRLIGAAALNIPRAGYAQTKVGLPVVGFLLPLKSESTFAKDRVTALRKGLQEAGFVEGTNYSLAVRFAEGNLDRYPELWKELGALNARVIVAVGAINGIVEFHRAFPEMPIVFTAIAADLVGLGLVRSYTHPGGMITGNLMNAVGGEETIAQKRIGLLKELVPGLTRLGTIAPANRVLAKQEKEALKKISAQLNFEVIHYDLNTIDDLESAFATALRDDVSAFYISTEPMLFAHLARVINSVKASRKPSVGTIPDWGREGLLISYATDILDGVLHAGIYAGKILNGAKPRDLPIEQASKFTLVINQKTANALGITVPPTLLALADEVIE